MFQSEESFCLCREFCLWDNIAITPKLYSLYGGNAVELLLDKIHLWIFLQKDKDWPHKKKGSKNYSQMREF